MIISDLREIKSILEIDSDDHAEDKLLLLLLEQASSWIEEILDRPLTVRSRTEYYAGTGTSKLLLKARPVYTSPTIAVNVDGGGYYGQATSAFPATTALTYGDDFVLNLDPGNDGTSRNGILIRLNDVWPRPEARKQGLLAPYVGEGLGNVKVTYTAGYTIDSLPATLRMACNMLVARMRYVLPLGVELNSESFEERNISIVNSERSRLLALVYPLVYPYRNWKW